MGLKLRPPHYWLIFCCHTTTRTEKNNLVHITNAFRWDLYFTLLAYGGTVVDSGYATQVSRIVSADFKSLLQLYSSIDGNTRGTFYLFVQPITGNTINYFAAIKWLELT